MKKTIAGGILSIGIFVLFLMAEINPDKAYYCDTEKTFVQCNRLSPTNKTCYFNDELGDERGDRCVDSTWVHWTDELVASKMCEDIPGKNFGMMEKEMGYYKLFCCEMVLAEDYSGKKNRCKLRTMNEQ